MELSLNFRRFTIGLILLLGIGLNAQINSGVYLTKPQKDQPLHELKVDNGYLILSSYQEQPAAFVSTLGGFLEVKDNMIIVKLEFNSNFEQDAIRELKYPYSIANGILKINAGEQLEFHLTDGEKQELDGQWLFGTRGPDKGQERRGDNSSRKTLKFLQNGRFQWIAYNVESMKFHGTGGGSYRAVNGIYQENIEYFSRDNSRVGASLNFEYSVEGNDWHHKGKNSKGEPMYEIWMKRK